MYTRVQASLGILLNSIIDKLDHQLLVDALEEALPHASGDQPRCCRPFIVEVVGHLIQDRTAADDDCNILPIDTICIVCRAFDIGRLAVLQRLEVCPILRHTCIRTQEIRIVTR